MRTVRSLIGVLWLGLAAALHAETQFYPESFVQAYGVTLNMPAGTTTATLPQAVGNAYLAASKKVAWRTQTRATRTDYLMRDATPDNAYDNDGVPRTFVEVPLSDARGTRQSWFAAVEARHAGGALVQLLVGIDANGDGLPQPSEEVCRIGQEAYDQQRCLLDLRGKTDRPLWAFARSITGGRLSGEYVSVSIATADFQLSGNKVSIAPSDDFLAAPGAGTAPVRVDFSYRPDAAHAGSDPFEAVGGLLLTAADESLATAVAWPLRVEFTPLARNDQAHALAARYDNFDDVKIDMPTLGVYEGLYADNPGQDLLEVVVLNREASVFIWREELPAGSTDSRAIPVSPSPQTQGIFLAPGMLPGAPNYEQVCAGCPSNLAVGNSRLRFSVRNWSDEPITVRLRVRLARVVDFATRQPPGLQAPSGNYYNPLRSGDGIFLDLVNQAQVFYWYTFDADGQPVWYSASAEPSYDNGAVGTFNTTLFRIRQRIAMPREVEPVGRIVLTSASNDRRELMFSWSIDGEHGSNRIRLAIAPGCTQQASGQTYNLTGHWFDFGEPGWGTNLLGLRNDIAEGLYLFDAFGNPRWVFGLLGLNGQTWSGVLYQFKGACPTCTYVAPTHTPAGNASVNFSNDSHADASYAVTFIAPLQGSFTQSAVPIRRATTAVTCTP